MWRLCKENTYGDICVSANSLSCLALIPLLERNVWATDVTGRLGKRDFTNLCKKGKNVLEITLYVYIKRQILGTIFSQAHKTVLNLMSYGKGYNVLLRRTDLFFFFSFFYCFPLCF